MGNGKGKGAVVIIGGCWDCCWNSGKSFEKFNRLTESIGVLEVVLSLVGGEWDMIVTWLVSLGIFTDIAEVSLFFPEKKKSLGGIGKSLGEGELWNAGPAKRSSVLLVVVPLLIFVVPLVELLLLGLLGGDGVRERLLLFIIVVGKVIVLM